MRAGCGNGVMADPLRHRQTKGAATDMVDLTPPRHIPTLPRADPGRLSRRNGATVRPRDNCSRTACGSHDTAQLFVRPQTHAKRVGQALLSKTLVQAGRTRATTRTLITPADN